MRKGSLAALKRKLWSLFAVYVLARDERLCFTCDRPANQAGHFYSYRLGSVRFDPKNVHAQCATCNLFMRGNPGAYAERIVLHYGLEELHRLTRRANQVTKQWKRDELELLIAALVRDPSGAEYESTYYEHNL